MGQKSLSPLEPGYVGIDVAKACLDVALLPGEAHQQFANDAAGRAALVVWALEQGPQLCVLEATGGDEAAIAADLTTAGLAVAVVNPRQVRAFAQAIGQTAKTDSLDAVVLARYGQALQPRPRPRPDAKRQELLALVQRRREVVALRTAELLRLAMLPSPTVANWVRAHITWLNTQL
jgi:transposase